MTDELPSLLDACGILPCPDCPRLTLIVLGIIIGLWLATVAYILLAQPEKKEETEDEGARDELCIFRIPCP
jgi:hypothetical protein